ncbi:MAG: hypothetical protein KDI44_19350 [Thiothrix sp.]|nr:hypothetical protein [Thiothrix sp.]
MIDTEQFITELNAVLERYGMKITRTSALLTTDPDGPEPASGCVSGHFDPCPGHPSGHPEEGKDAARLAAIKSRLRGMMRKGG